MALLEKQLVVKKSTLPNAGKGLFTRKTIPKGTRIVEYKGTITTWKEVDHNEGSNGYIYYINRNTVINARPHPDYLARYANDAKGIAKLKGVTNNAVYATEGLKAYIESTKEIPAGAEIFVGYGKEYWDTIRHNIKLDKKKKGGK
ncbi:MAG: SET domain-containing protein [Terrimonas sp.]|nr:SET domain-containing protein [Terrimonas sp.]OJY92834.1 MAG: SET domain-containing protein-lysine N-methyltransferase [Sphingobacteriales bacterium 40-81]